ncbi:tRNA (adenine(58)-N(1))-methyltransferase non-catalytic subunit trm6 [Quaeritorhiza haematococci]|nr:tRNA (adenine(58)-N(1))-methyltransferase non-catalytic subunit trm6 [Quaeritorhiza haematococci]
MQQEQGAVVAREGQHVLIQMPSGNQKTVCLKKDSEVSLGKFGSFAANELIGKPFDVSYEIFGKKELRPVSRSLVEVFDVESEQDANNRELKSDPSSQKLTHFEIEQMKVESLKGEVTSESLIKTIIENSTTFEQKTEFSKAKYIKRKERKFSKMFKPLNPNARLLCEHFFTKNPQKIRELRIDTLSQILSYANVHPGAKVIVVDDTQGLVVSAILERLGDSGTVLAIHDREASNFDVLRYMNIPPTDLSKMLKTISWRKFQEWQERQREGEDTQTGDDDPMSFLRKKYDGLVLASGFQPAHLISTLSPLLAGSRPVVAYHPSKEVLLDAYVYMRKSPEFVNMQLTESWLREYQVPVNAPGTRPLMLTSATGGFLLSGIRVFDEEEDVVEKDQPTSKANGEDSERGADNKKPKLEA